MEEPILKAHIPNPKNKGKSRSPRHVIKHGLPDKGIFKFESGSYLPSQAVASQVLSAYKGLTSVFGMGTGGFYTLQNVICTRNFLQLRTISPDGIIYMPGVYLIYAYGGHINGAGGKEYKNFITNARIVRISYGGAVGASSNYSQELFFNTLELSEVRDIYIPKGYPGKLVLEIRSGEKITFTVMPSAYDVISELNIYISAALKRMVPIIEFEDPDERFLFKEKELSHYNAFCSKEFWEMIFGGERDIAANARFCVTNKRLLYYYVDQISGLRGDGLSINYSITAPVFKFLWIPLSGITSVGKEKRGLFHFTCLHIRNCVPAGCISRSSTILGIDRQGGELMYDPAYIDAVGGTAVVDFDHFSFLSKTDRQEVTDILRSLLPGIGILEQ